MFVYFGCMSVFSLLACLYTGCVQLLLVSVCSCVLLSYFFLQCLRLRVAVVRSCWYYTLRLFAGDAFFGCCQSVSCSVLCMFCSLMLYTCVM